MPKKSAAEIVASKAYAKNHGLSCGSQDQNDDVPSGEQPELNMEAMDEGLLVYVQSTTCRHVIWATAFESKHLLGNKRPDGVLCCDICSPTLLDHTRPGSATVTTKMKTPKKENLNVIAKQKLDAWRKRIVQRDYPNSMMASSAILDDSTIELIACIGSVVSTAQFKQVLMSQWVWWDVYGSELDTYRQSIMPQHVSKPKKGQGKKKTTCGEGDVKRLAGEVHFKPVTILAPGPLENDAYSSGITFHHYSPLESAAGASTSVPVPQTGQPIGLTFHPSTPSAASTSGDRGSRKRKIASVD